MVYVEKPGEGQLAWPGCHCQPCVEGKEEWEERRALTLRAPNYFSHYCFIYLLVCLSSHSLIMFITSRPMCGAGLYGMLPYPTRSLGGLCYSLDHEVS